MRKIILLLALFISVSVSAQIEKYHRVKIWIGENGILELSKAGISVDHGDYKKGVYYTSDLSDSEVAAVKKTGLKYEVQIPDVGNFYAHQNDGLRNYDPKNEVQTAGSCNSCPQFDTPQNFNLGSMGGFFTYSELLDILDSMASKYPNLITVRQPVNASAFTEEGNSLYFVKISDNPNTNEASESQVLYTSLHHAREAESLSQLIFYMWYLLENYQTNTEVQYLLNNLELYFIPCVNPDGYQYNETIAPSGGGMWRKNRHDNGDGTYGVDLNRNYGEGWGFDDNGSSPFTNNDTYRGTAGFSEQETQMVRDFCNSHTFKLALNNHTYSNLLIYPWGYIAGFETPDSTIFRGFAKRMVRCSGFKYGTGDQTVGYLTNGDSDDWMYGEQMSKPMILSMTPEAGSGIDGFWPAINRIVDIAKITMDQNLCAARLVAAYGEALSLNDRFITSTNSYVKYDLTRLGLMPSNLVVTLIPVSSNISSGSSAVVYTGMNLLETRRDSIAITLNGGLAQGDVVKYVLSVSNGSYQHNDTITQLYGQPVTAFFSNCNATSSFTTSGGTWGISTNQFVSATGSITDSPSGMYQNNINKNISTTSNIDLTDALAADLSFFAKWDVEKGYDYVEIMVSTNGGASYTPLCGKYTVEGTDDQDGGQPLYDGIQTAFVKESIDLGAYLGQNIKLRFKLASDGFQTGDGFYFDDLTVLKLVNAVGLNETKTTVFAYQSMPNPCSDHTTIRYTLPASNDVYTLTVYDELGRTVQSQVINNQANETGLDVSSWQNGVYYYRIASSINSSPAKPVVVIH
ncbi:MAG: hypothetical protein K0S33_3434 [Bacteroidetes bacterium]|nr:hypothetical protein [Bacteroidota bacterium]